jgi:hypothetical protein
VKQKLLVAGIALWLVGNVTTFGYVWKYKTTPGTTGAVPPSWPADSAIIPVAGKPNLVVFTHPQCPCTRATIAELARIAGELGDHAQLHVVLVRPTDAPPHFEDGAIAERAATIRGVKLVVDDGSEARRFGSVTSGATVLYTSDGALAFHGGLTTARGHEGRSPAHAQIAEVVLRDSNTTLTTPVFGCEIDRQLTVAR